MILFYIITNSYDILEREQTNKMEMNFESQAV